jgi:hypothetical protein
VLHQRIGLTPLQVLAPLENPGIRHHTVSATGLGRTTNRCGDWGRLGRLRHAMNHRLWVTVSLFETTRTAGGRARRVASLPVQPIDRKACCRARWTTASTS